jgi:TonB-dependent starch-binding outer membrane protein SusC
MYRLTTQDLQRFAGSLGAQYTPLPSLNLDMTFGVDVASEQNVRHIPFGWNVDAVSNATPQGQRTVRNRDNRQYTVDIKSSWNEDLSPRINSAFVLGGQAFFEQSMRAGGTGTRFSGPGLEIIDAGADQSVFERRVQQVSGGVFAQEQIGIDNWVFLTLGARYDKHSAFGETAGGALYPKVSVSVVPTDMPGWNDSELLSSVRVRGAVGTSGLQPGAFDKFTTFSPVISTTGPGVAPNNLGNPDLRPEVSREFEGGADIGLFNDRISVNGTYWNRTVDDLLVARQFAYSGGFRFPQLDNIGQMKAWGTEVGVSGMIFNNPVASLELFANAAYLRERVTDMGGSPPIKPGYVRYRNTIKEGYAPGSFFGPKLVEGDLPIDITGDGRVNTRAEILAYLSQPMNDSNRDLNVLRGVMAPAEDGTLLGHYLGKPTPDWTGAFGGTMNFLQNFKVATLFEYKAGNYSVHNLTDAFRRSHNAIGRNVREASEVEAILKNPASTPEQRLEAARVWVTELQSLTPYDGLGEIEAADNVRWRELSLSYRVPGRFIERFAMNNMELTFAGRNIALWTKYSGVDPDLNVIGGWSPDAESQEFNNFVTGVEGWGFAMPRRFSLSASIGF